MVLSREDSATLWPSCPSPVQVWGLGLRGSSSSSLLLSSLELSDTEVYAPQIRANTSRLRDEGLGVDRGTSPEGAPRYREGLLLSWHQERSPPLLHPNARGPRHLARCGDLLVEFTLNFSILVFIFHFLFLLEKNHDYFIIIHHSYFFHFLFFISSIIIYFHLLF